MNLVRSSAALAVVIAMSAPLPSRAARDLPPDNEYTFEAGYCSDAIRAEANSHPLTLSKALEEARASINNCPAETIIVDEAMSTVIEGLLKAAQAGAGKVEYRTYILKGKNGRVHATAFTTGTAEGAIFTEPDTDEDLIGAAHTHPHETSFSPADLVNAKAGFEKPTIVTNSSGTTYVAFMNRVDILDNNVRFLLARANHLMRKVQCALHPLDSGADHLARDENMIVALADMMKGQVYVLRPGEPVMRRLHHPQIPWLEQSDMLHWPHDRFDDIVIRTDAIVFSDAALGKPLDVPTLAKADPNEVKQGMTTVLASLKRLGYQTNGTTTGYIFGNDSRYAGDSIIIRPVVEGDNCDSISLTVRRPGDPLVTRYIIGADNSVKQAREPDPWDGKYFQRIEGAPAS